jgi:hypothetical protein
LTLLILGSLYTASVDGKKRKVSVALVGDSTASRLFDELVKALDCRYTELETPIMGRVPNTAYWDRNKDEKGISETFLFLFPCLILIE